MPEGFCQLLRNRRRESISPVRTLSGGKPGGRGECGARGRLCNPLPGGSGIMPAGTRTGA